MGDASSIVAAMATTTVGVLLARLGDRVRDIEIFFDIFDHFANETTIHAQVQYNEN